MLEKELIQAFSLNADYFSYLKFSPYAFRAQNISKHDGSSRTLMIPVKQLKIIQQFILKKYRYLVDDNRYLNRQYAYMKDRNNILYAKNTLIKDTL